MNTQLFLEYCGWEVSSWWCALTDIEFWITILIFLIASCLIIKYLRKRDKEKKCPN